MLALLVACLLGESHVSEAALLERVLHPTPESLELAGRDLGAEEFAVRDQATRYLWYCGPRALEVLRTAMKSGDFEVRSRAKQVLTAIEGRTVPTIAEPRLQGVVQCRLGRWHEGLQTLCDADAFDLVQALSKEIQASESVSAPKVSEWQEAFEQRDWPALFKLAQNVEGTNLRGTTLRLALLPELGRDQEAPVLLEELRSLVAAEPVLLGQATCELILGRRPDEALKLNRELRRMAAFQLLVGDLRFREAFAAVGISLPLRDPESWMEKFWGDQTKAGKDEYTNSISSRAGEVALVAETAARLGEADVASRLMTKAGDLAETDEWYGWALRSIWRRELKMGQSDRAWQHLATTAQNMLQHKDKGPEIRNQALDGGHFEAAGVWWDYFRGENPNAPLEETAKTVVSLLDPKTSNVFSAEEVRTFIAKLRAHIAQLAGDERVRAVQAAAETADIHKLADLSQAIWKQLDELKPSATSALALADHFAAAEQWSEAASWYGRAWSRDRKQLFAVVLQAKALDQVGKAEEADRMRLLARLWPTGDDLERAQIAFALHRRGQMSEAHKQYTEAGRYVKQLSLLPNILISVAEQQAPTAPAEAAKTWNIVRLLVMGDGTIITSDEVEGPFSGRQEIVQRIHQLKARSLIASGQLDVAWADALAAEAACPAGLRLPIELVMEFDKAGSTANGDRLFERMWSRRQDVLDDFPKAAEFHEQLAEIGAACRRRLNESLAHAEIAVNLRPRQVSSLVALARVHHARGDKEAAGKYLARVLAIEPSSEIARKLQQELDKPQHDSR